MLIKIFQIGWNYSQDGPGNRLIFHFQGCNFDCPWCSNPEGRSREGEIFIRPELLVPEVCPHGMISGGRLNREFCHACPGKECLHKNRNQGIRLTAQAYRVEELVKKALEARPLFFDGGGVTISGGEATVQFEGLKALVRELKDAGIHTALETNGSHRSLIALLPFVDLLIFDLKHWDFGFAESVLKNNGRYVMENLKACIASEQDILVRITLIPGFNDSERDSAQFGTLLSSLRVQEKFRLELLCYHRYGKEKWAAIGQEYHGPEESIGETNKVQYKEILESFGLSLVST